MLSITDPKAIVIGMDVSKSTIALGVSIPGEEVTLHKLAHDEVSIRRLLARFPDPTRIRTCYEAGPTGFELYRLLQRMGVACEVVAPSLVPTLPGARVKTDKRDARHLTLLYRAGQLTPIHVPSPEQEALRDLNRARADLVDHRSRLRQQLVSMLLRHGLVYREGSNWTQRHERWLSSLDFDQPALATAFSHYRAVLALADQNLRAIEADLAPYWEEGPFADPVHRLAAYRGINYLGALTLVTEVGDWRRFPTASDLMGYVGLVPSEYSSGEGVSRGRLTKAGNGYLRRQLVESAWAYRFYPRLGRDLTLRQAGIDPAVVARSWAAQERLCRRWGHLSHRKHHKGTVSAALARELCGFLWAEMNADPAPQPWVPSS